MTNRVLEHMQDYKGEAIMIWRVTGGRLKGTRYFTYGSGKYDTMAEAKAIIDAIGTTKEAKHEKA